MQTLSPVNRPATLGDLARVFDVPIDDLRRLAKRHGIAPACRIGNLPVYGPRQIRRIYAVLRTATTA
jgi:hypothetical protein